MWSDWGVPPQKPPNKAAPDRRQRHQLDAAEDIGDGVPRELAQYREITRLFMRWGAGAGGRRGAGARAANPKSLGANAHTKRPEEPIKQRSRAVGGATAPDKASAANRRGTTRVTLDERMDVVRREAAVEMHTPNR